MMFTIRRMLGAGAVVAALVLAPAAQHMVAQHEGKPADKGLQELLGAASNAESASSDYLLVLDGIPGESTDKRRPGSIEISSFSWGASNPSSVGGGGGGGGGKVSFSSLNLLGPASKASPTIMQKVATGAKIETATLYGRKSKNATDDFYKIELKNVFIESYQTSGSSSGDAPTDSFSLVFEKITFVYAGASQCWNVVENKICTP